MIKTILLSAFALLFLTFAPTAWAASGCQTPQGWNPKFKLCDKIIDVAAEQAGKVTSVNAYAVVATNVPGMVNAIGPFTYGVTLTDGSTRTVPESALVALGSSTITAAP